MIRSKYEETYNEKDKYEKNHEDEGVRIDALSRDELKTRLRNVGSKVTGTRTTLQTRLKGASRKDDSETESEDDDDTEEEYVGVY